MDAQVLGGVGLFSALDGDGLAAVAAAGAVVERGAHQVLFAQGDAADELYVVLDGGVRIDRSHDSGGAVEVQRLGPGMAFGEPALLDRAPRSATVAITTPSRSCSHAPISWSWSRPARVYLATSSPAPVRRCGTSRPARRAAGECSNAGGCVIKPIPAVEQEEAPRAGQRLVDLQEGTLLPGQELVVHR